MNKISGAMTALALLVTMSGMYADSSPSKEKAEPTQTTTGQEAKSDKTVNKDCEAPDWAKAIGHEEKWKLHNGCKGK